MCIDVVHETEVTVDEFENSRFLSGEGSVVRVGRHCIVGWLIVGC